ncbi:prepilin peptidase [Kibdelosporangium philippinense]|uniref:Prepilin peptidase n=1 Tax=Kibdelosporangium philippinense TaxID=211113 RepID=A0ABS8ZQQ4_9PSEU|nr:prepilin peptidase [Kibdelosporangium philippinense]MCE7009947.1 prepilin peptidase [Kibdelosporangium philippinense]
MLIVLWAGVGAVVAILIHVWTRRLLAADRRGWLTAPPTASLLTAVLFGLLAWRIGWNIELLPYSYLAAIGVSLSIVDIVKQRLPKEMILTSAVVLGTLFGVLSIAHSDSESLVRALVGSILSAGFYLVMALASDGGLGAGDIKLGALLGLVLGWLSWSALALGVFLAACVGSTVCLLLRLINRLPENRIVPGGPFLLFGAVVAISVMPTS